MHRIKIRFEKAFEGRPAATVTFATLTLLMAVWVPSCFAQHAAPQTFSSPQEASRALFTAVKNDNEQAVMRIFGAEKELASTGDDIQDKLEHEQFARKYGEMHRLVREPDGTTVLYIGAENWPFPVPLVASNGAWYFDCKTGKREVLFRRIGKNEATAIELCHALVVAKKQDGAIATDGDPINQYAQSLVSGGTANANDSASVSPFHGYHVRILSGELGNPGTRPASHVVGSKKGSVALVAYPAEYRSSGVMTFIVAEDGRLYERDLGPETVKLAQELQTRAPASAWHAVK